MRNHKTGCCGHEKKNDCCKKKTSSSALLKFSGVFDGSISGNKYMTDTGTALMSISALGYPIATRTTFRSLSVNMASVTPGITLTFRLLRDGVPVPGFEVVYDGSTPPQGVKTVTPATPVTFNAGQQLDLQVVPSNTFEDTLLASATLS